MKNTTQITVLLFISLIFTISNLFAIQGKFIPESNDFGLMNISLSGRTLSGSSYAHYIDGNLCFTGSGDKLSILDITDIDSPHEISSLYINGQIADIVTKGENLYIGGSGITVIDISDPYTPDIIAYFPGNTWIQEILIDESYLYTASSEYGLSIFDISVPHAPSVVATTDAAFTACGLDIIDNYLFITDYDYGFRVFDVSDPSDPEEINSVFSPNGYNFKVKISNNKLYANNISGLNIYDISDITDIVNVGNCDEVWGTDLLIDENKAYLSGINNLIEIVDISDVTSPTLVSVVPLDESSSVSDLWTISITNEGNHLVASDAFHGLRFFDVTDMTAIFECTDYKTYTFPVVLTIYANHAFVLTNTNEISVVNITESTNPKVIVSYTTDYEIKSIEAKDNRLYVAGQDIFEIYDIEDVEDISLLTHYDLSIYKINSITIHDDFIYLGTTSMGLCVLQINEDNEIISENYMSDIFNIKNVTIFDNIMYIVSSYNGLYLVDISNPNEPYIVNFLTSATLLNDVEIVNQGGLYYACMTDLDGLTILDVTDIYNINEVADFRIDHGARNIEIRENIAYLATNKYGFTAIDIIDIESPTLAGYYLVDGGATHIEIDETNGYFVNFNSGFYVLDIDLAVSAICEVTNTEPENYHLNSYPNPFNGACQIDVPGKSYLYVYDNKGQMVTSFDNSMNDALDTFNWIPATTAPSGTYHAKVVTEGGTTINSKIVYLK